MPAATRGRVDPDQRPHHLVTAPLIVRRAAPHIGGSGGSGVWGCPPQITRATGRCLQAPNTVDHLVPLGDIARRPGCALYAHMDRPEPRASLLLLGRRRGRL